MVYFDNSVSTTLDNGGAVAENVIDDLLRRGLKPIDFVSNSDRVKVVERSILEIESGSQLNGKRMFDRVNESSILNNYLVSDFQSFSIDSFEEASFDSTKNYHILLLSELNDLRNISVDTLWFHPNPDDLSKISVRVGFTTFNISSGSVVIKLLRGTKQVSSVVKSVSDLGVIEFDVPIDGYGAYSLEVEGDDVLYDNVFYFVIGERSKPSVTILNKNGNRAIVEVFGNQELFDSKKLDIQSLDYERLNDSDLIVFNGYENLPTNLIDQFRDKVFLIFPPDSVNLETYNNLDNLKFTNTKGVFEIEIEEQHVLMRGIFEENLDLGSTSKFRQVFAVDGFFNPIISFRDGKPFLLLSQSIYVFNTPLAGNSGFESNALFLPLLYQIAFSSANDIDIPYYYPGDKLSLSIKALDIPVRLSGDNYEIIPSFNTNGTQTIIEIPDDIDPGLYRIVQDDDTLREIAINLPKSESEMKSPTYEELKNFFSNYENVNVSQALSDSGNMMFAQTQPVSLWKYALILTLLFILTETMLHRYLR